jgi:hypothetical protein
MPRRHGRSRHVPFFPFWSEVRRQHDIRSKAGAPGSNSPKQRLERTPARQRAVGALGRRAPSPENVIAVRADE